MRMMRGSIVAVAVIVATCAPAMAKGRPAEPARDPVVTELLRLHNRERAKQKKPPLKLDAKLSAAAQDYAKFLASTGRFGHSEKGTMASRIKAQGYRYRAIGENIAKGQRTASSVVGGWMNSPGHRSNILNGGYREVGFGVARDRKGQLYWVTDFGTER